MVQYWEKQMPVPPRDCGSSYAFPFLTGAKISWVMVPCAYGSWWHQASIVYIFIGKESNGNICQ